jgi:Type VI secretion system/phage-baseplate injector OB domain
MSAMSGLYRAKVENNVDPHDQFRLQVSLPDIQPESLVWATACVSVSGQPSVPPIGATVWIAFEKGDPRSPVWLGIAPS